MIALDKIQNVVHYVATRNSTGIQTTTLRVRGDDYIVGEESCFYTPWGHVSQLGKGIDWRIAHTFATKEEATADYIALEKGRIAAAQAALKDIGAEV
jgi:hypothetical protein